MKHKMTCADCEFHDCSIICRNGKPTCNGSCLAKAKHKKCDRTICKDLFKKDKTPQFIMDLLYEHDYL